METTGLDVLSCTQQSALHTIGILQLKGIESAGCFQVREDSHSVLHLCFLPILFPVTECWSWLWCLVKWSSDINSKTFLTTKLLLSPFSTVH